MTLFPEQVGHYLDIAVARMVEAWQPEATLHGAKQREVAIEIRALHTGRTVIRDNNGGHLVESRGVVILVPHNNDRVVPLTPGGRRGDGSYDLLHCDVATENFRFVQP